MSQNAESIVAYLELLHANRHLIAAAYCDGGVQLNDANQRQIHKLQQHRVLLPYYQQDYRLNVSLVHHFHEVFQRERSYAVGANFAELINRLPPLMEEYRAACYENRLDDQQRYAEEFDAGVFELAALVNNELLSLRVITENQFANVRTLAEKQRQNQFYLDRAEKIGDAIAMLAAESLRQTLDSSELLKPLLQIYLQQIQQRLQEWRATHLDITAVLKAFLYRLRQVEPNARRLRAFAHHLRQHADYSPPDADSLEQLPEWAQRFPGLKPRAHPDLSHSLTRDSLAELAHLIPAAPLVFSTPRHAGKRLLDSSNSSTAIAPKLVQQALHRYLQQAQLSPTPLSAHAWKQQQHEFQSLSTQHWLFYVLHAVQLFNKQNQYRQLHSERIEQHSSHRRSGNVVVIDVQVWAPAPQTKLSA